MRASTKAKQEFEDSDTINLGGVFQMTDWYMANIPTLAHYKKVTRLYSDNREYLKATLGWQEFCSLDSGNRRLYVWKILLEGGPIWILTARERGTSYEILQDDMSDSFMKEIFTYLSSLYNFKDLYEQELQS
jgi:hypothetical protein